MESSNSNTRWLTLSKKITKMTTTLTLKMINDTNDNNRYPNYLALSYSKSIINSFPNSNSSIRKWREAVANEIF